MKIVAINGSPRGRASNTGVMVDAFLKGAQEAGAETMNVFLAEKNIKYCRGCYSCWTETPGRCVIQDDMAEVLSRVAGADVIVLASPLYFNNISGTLKVFMDRLAVTGNPHSPKSRSAAPKLVMISNCGFPDRSQFQVVSLWIKRVARLMRTEVIGEIYATQGRFLTAPTEEVRPAVASYLRFLEKAGAEIATSMKLSETTESLLGRDFMSPNVQPHG